MSVQCNTYVMIGVKIPYPEEATDEFYDKIEPYTDSSFGGIEHRDGLTVLLDGMNGEYMTIGKILAKTESYEGFEHPIEVHFNNEEFFHVASSIEEHFGIKNPKVGVWVISHYR